MWNFKINVSLLRKTILKLKTFQQLHLTLRGRGKRGLMTFSWNVLFKNLQEYIIDLACTFCLKNPLKWMTKKSVKLLNIAHLNCWRLELTKWITFVIRESRAWSAWSWFLCNLKIDFVTFQQKCHTHCIRNYEIFWPSINSNHYPRKTHPSR